MTITMAAESPPPLLTRDGTAPTPLVATVWVLDALQPIATQLQSCLEHLTPEEAETLDARVRRTGGAAVHVGEPDGARVLRDRLQQAGLITSLNLR
jgi:hypothetical protein